MGIIPLIGEIFIFLLLSYAYYNLCTHREISIVGKVVEVISLYAVSIWAILGNIKFIFWVLAIAVIGVIKILTTKKKSFETGHNGMAD